MATLNEITYDLLSIVRPQLSDDNDIDERQIKFWINNQRALWIRNELNKKRTIDSDVIQTICADLEEVNTSDCCDIELDCSTILRTTKKLPETIELHNKQAILRTAPIDKISKPFSFIEYLSVPFVGNGKFNSKNIFSFLHDGYIYLYSKGNPRYKMISNISIRGEFEDPTAASNFKDCGTNEPCYTDDSPYPIKSWMIPALKQAILQSNLMIEAQADIQAKDNANNAKSDVKA